MNNPNKPIPSAPWQYIVRKAKIPSGTAIYDPKFTERMPTIFSTWNRDYSSDFYVCGVVIAEDGNITHTLTAQFPRGDANEFKPVFQITDAHRNTLGNERFYLTENKLAQRVSIDAFLAEKLSSGVNRIPDNNISGDLVTALRELQKSSIVIDQILSGGIPPGPGAGRAAPPY